MLVPHQIIAIYIEDHLAMSYLVLAGVKTFYRALHSLCPCAPMVCRAKRIKPLRGVRTTFTRNNL